MIFLLIGIFLTSCLTLTVLFFLLRSISDFKAMIFDLVQPQGDKPSKLVEFLDGIALLFSAKLVSSAEAALRGSMGGAQKAENREALGPLAMFQGRLGKNPMLNMLLQGILSKFGNREADSAASGSNHSKEVKFHL